MMSSRVRGVLVLSLVAVLATLAASPVAARQTGSISGRVTAEGGQRALSSAQVFIPETGIGGLSNADGVFLLLNVPVGEHTVEAQSLGFATTRQTVSVTAGNATTVNFELQQSAIELGEVVVTGAGQATERRKIGNTIETINSEELESAPILDVTEVLQSRTPGVMITAGGGLPGEGSQIRIRGSSSLAQSNNPIIYVDGVRIDNDMGYGTNSNSSRLDDINPNSIERVEILKGAAAATLYGTEASNGVIQIFTRRGQAGAPRWTFEVGGGFSRAYEGRYEPLAGFAYAEEATPGRDRGTQGIAEWWGIDVEPYEVFSVSIPDIIMETGLHQNYSGSVSGGNDLVTYYVGGRYTWEDGIMGAEEWGPIRDIESAKQASMNLSLLPSENLRLQVSTRYTDRHHTPTEDGTPNSAISITMLAKPEFADANNPGGWRAFATLPEAMQIVQSEDTKRFGGAFTANYSFTPSLSIEATAGVDIVSQIASQFRPFGWNVSGVTQETPEGYREVWDRSHDEFTLESRATWNTDLSDQLTSGFVIGGQTLIANSHTTLSVGEQFPGPGLEVTGAGAIQSNTETILKTVSAGVYAQEQIGFRNYLFFTVGARYDKHSAFGEEAGGAIYPKASFSLVPSDMPGWDGLGPVSTLRLRAAVGQSGLQPGAFDALTTFSPLASEMGPGVEPDNLGNPELEPEVATEWEAGFEAGFFDNRFALDLTYWNRTVSDLLVARQFAPTGGFLSTQLDNVGQMDAWGLELGLNGQVYSGGGVSVNAFVSGAYIQEEITDMGGAPPIDFGTRNRSWIREGYSPGAFFGGKLVDVDYPFDTNGDGEPDSESELLTYFGVPRSPDVIEATMMAVDEDGDGDLLDHFLGKPTPDWTGGFGADVSIGSNLTISTLFEYRAGNFQITNHTEGFRYSSVNLGRNTPEAAQIESTLLNPASSAEDRLAAAKRYTETGAALAKFNGLNQVQDADFIRWREMSVSYRLPASFVGGLGADDIALTASARNLMLWTTYLGIDPETKNSPDSNIDLGHDAHKLGLPRRFSFSVRVNF